MYRNRDLVGTATAQICEKIWLSIAEKRLRPGTRLKEEELAEIFDVSRARIRQALSVLESDGLVTIVPNRGAFVSEPTVDEARDIFLVRKMVEGRVIERVVERITPEGLGLLEDHLAAERAAHARGDTSEAIQLAGGFHMVLVSLAESPFLESVMRDLVSRSSLITSMYRVRHIHNCAPDDHDRLIAAIRNGDADRARAEMDLHLDHVRDELNLSDDRPAARDLRQALG